MFRLELPKLVVNTDSITGIRWQVSTHGRFTDDIVLDKTKTELMESLESSLPLEDGDSYFVRTKIMFDNGDEVDWSRAILINNSSKGFIAGNTIVQTPRVTIEADEDNVPLVGFEVKLSPFLLFKGVGVYLSTDWRVVDFDGNVIWERTGDKHNKTSIRLPGGILDIEKSYIIEARYNSTSNGRSSYGKLHINTVTKTNSSVTVTSDSKVNQDLEKYMLELNTNMYKIMIEVLKHDENNID